jgi:hypothetical protein
MEKLGDIGGRLRATITMDDCVFPTRNPFSSPLSLTEIGSKLSGKQGSYSLARQDVLDRLVVERFLWRVDCLHRSIRIGNGHAPIPL